MERPRTSGGEKEVEDERFYDLPTDDADEDDEDFLHIDSEEEEIDEGD